MRFSILTRFVTLLIATALTGCASVPYEELNLDTTTNFKSPSNGQAGVYVYQWKRGIIGSLTDVTFEIRGQRKIALNTGEYGYLELAPGQYEYKFSGGLSPTFFPIKLELGRNYFFRAFLFQFTDYSVLIRDQQEINEAKENIGSGRYEPHDVD
jgi:hypothetical protein